MLSAGEFQLDWGETQTVTAKSFVGTKQQGVDGITWTSADESIASVTPGDDGAALIKGLGEGTTTITAKLREATAELSVTVLSRVLVLQTIEVTAGMASVPRGLTIQLQATGHYDDGSTRDLTQSCAWASGDSAKARVNSTGLVTAVDVGTVEIRALKSGVTGTLQLTVSTATLSSIDVRPSSTSLALGTTQNFTATGRFSDASTMNLGSMVTWSSEDTNVVSIDATGRATAAQLGATTISAAFMGVSGDAQVTVTDATLRALEATPSTFTLPLGSSQAITVSGRFSDGTMQDMTAMAMWRSGTLGVATVDGGVVTAVGQGLSVITASVGAISTTASATCTAAQLSSILVEPQNPSVPRGLTQTLTATGVYTDATRRDLTDSVTWSSADAGVAAVSNLSGENGLVNALNEGTVLITASNGTLSGNTSFTVLPAIPVSLSLSPSVVSVAAGLTQPLSATGSFSDGTMRDVTTAVTWTSQDAGVAIVSNDLDAGTVGLLTGVAPGSTTIDATLGLVTAARAVTVGAPVLQRIDVTSSTGTSVAKGRTLALTATGTYSDGSQQNLTSTATWAPASGTTFRVASTGVLTALQTGTASASATVGGVTGALSITVTPAELDVITISPASPSIPLGLTQQLSAQGTYSDGTSAPITTGLTWTAGDALIAVSTSGLVSTNAEGQSSVTAAVGSVNATVQVQVIAPVVVAIDLTPSTTITLDKTQTQQITAQGTLSNGQSIDVTNTATWSSTLPAIATVSAGLVTAVTPGTTSITATQAGVSKSVSVAVNRPALASLAVTPVNPHVQRAGTIAFVATATYVDSSTEVVTSLVSWTSGDPSFATINASGVATGVAEGSTSISASWNGQSDSTSLTVDPLSLVSIAISGTSTFAVGTAVQLKATGTYADSTTADLTTQVTWASTNPTVVSFGPLVGIAQGRASGTTTVTATLASVTSPTFSVSVLDVNAPYGGRCAPGLVISGLFGGGGNSNATLHNDYVELHNPTAAPISLNGKSIQYASTAGSSWNALPLTNTSIPPGGYYLVMLASGGSNGATFTGNQTGSIDMAIANGKVALASVITALSGTCPTTNVLDFVGYGTANCSEGSAAPALTTSTALVRGASACRDGNQNNSDFTTTPAVVSTLRTLSSPAILCSCGANGVGSPEELNSCVLNSPANMSAASGDASSAVRATVTQAGVTDSAGFDSTLRVQVGVGPVSVSPATGSGWSWWPSTGSVAGTTSDSYDGFFVAPASGSYSFTARATRDGVNWTSCDLNGAGSGSGLALELGQLGALTVP